jgi:hypothetical protein
LAEAFIASRFGGPGGVFGRATLLPAEVAIEEILARAWPD